jgi:hypothetical protein
MDFSGPYVGNLSNKTQNGWHHSLDTKHYFVHAKFEGRSVISFMRKLMHSKKGHFSWVMDHRFFKVGV